jgi:glycosyltransferase involved in cell wall biosynthesis
MRILVLNWRSILSRKAGGAEVHCYEIFNRIAEKNNTVHLVASCDDLTKPKKASVGKIQVLHVTDKEIFYAIASFFKLPKFSLKYFDIVVEDVSKFPMIWPLVLSKFFSKPFIIIVHHVHGKTLFKEFSFPMAALMYISELFGLKLYSLFKPYAIVVSESTKKDLVSLGFDEEKIKVIYNGLSFDSQPRLAYEKKASFPLITYFGRVKKYKRLDHLLLAAKQVSLNVPNIKVKIAGRGDPEVYQELSTLANQIGLGKIVEFCGEVNEEKKVDILQNAWVYAIPSMKEGFGISVIEAQAFGVPVVAYDVPGLRDSVKHLVSGILVKDGDVNAFANALTMICKDKTLREKLAKGAVENASKYDWNKSAEEFLGLLNKVAYFPK